MKVKKLVPDAVVPKRQHPEDAGADVHSAVDLTVPARGRALVSTGIGLAVPPGFYCRVAPRSGLAVKHGIDVGAGVVDCGYVGEVKVLLFNHSDVPYSVARGDRIAQLIVQAIHTAPFEEFEALDATERGEGGFGSTGA
jgi:deoxyuridine 5'-triphosphate nucleotidohydrolase